MTTQIGDQYTRTLNASSTSANEADLKAAREIHYLKNLYGHASGYGSHASRGEFGAAFLLTLFFGLLLLSGVELTHLMEWGLQPITRAAFGW